MARRDYMEAANAQELEDMQQELLRESAKATGQTYDPVAKHITAAGTVNVGGGRHSQEKAVTTAITGPVRDKASRKWLIPVRDDASVDMRRMLGKTVRAPSGRDVTFPDSVKQVLDSDVERGGR